MTVDMQVTIEDLVGRGTSGALREVRQLIGRRHEPQLPWPTYRDLGRKVSQLDEAEASRTAWELFQQALREAEAAGAPRHTIRTQMADMLLREGKVRLAMQTYLQAFLEAPEPKPAYVEENLAKCFDRIERAAGVSLERFLELVESEGPKGPAGIDTAMRYVLTGIEPARRNGRRGGLSALFFW